MLSVICPVYNEVKYIDVCIRSILLQDYSQKNLEVLFVDGLSSDGTRDIIKRYSVEYPFIKLLDNPHRIVPFAMNIGIESAVGNIIMRLDAHALYPSNYFSTLVSELNRLGADNVGNSSFRLGVSKVMEVDTVPFGCWKRNVFEKYGYYDVRLIRNQDIELNKRIIRGGGHIYIVSDTYCTYLARETFGSISHNNYLNGKWNVLTVYYTGQFDSLSMRHFIPLLFVLSLLIPILLSILYFPIIFLTLFSLFLYLTMLVGICISLSLNKGLNFFYLLTSFVTLHLSYGWGSLIGMFELLVKKINIEFC